jgi:hypothetical protein
MVQLFMVQLFMVQLLKKSVLRALVPSQVVNRMWTKTKDHGPKSEGVEFFDICTKNGKFFKKNQL